jgi:hypothetical protein
MSNKTEVKPEEPTASKDAATSVQHNAPEDHYASGGQQQEQKNALKKSVDEKQRQPPPGQNAGQHSTGSFTGTTGGQGKKP